MLKLTGVDEDIEPVIWMGGAGEDPVMHMLTCSMIVTDPALLGTASITFRWNDGVAPRTHVTSVSTTALNAAVLETFAVRQGVGEPCDMTYEVNVPPNSAVDIEVGYTQVG